MDQGRHTEHEKDIGDVGTNDIANRYADGAFIYRAQTGHEFRNRRTETDQSEAYDQFGNVELTRNTDRSANQPLPSNKQEDEAAQNHQICHENPHGKD